MSSRKLVKPELISYGSRKDQSDSESRDLYQNLREKQMLISQFEIKVNKYHEQKKVLMQDIKKLKDSRKEWIEKACHAAEQMQTYKSQIQSLLKQLEENNTSMTTLQQCLKLAQAQSSGHQDELDILKKRIKIKEDDYTKIKAEHDIEKKQLIDQIDVDKAKIEDLDGELTAVKETRDQLQKSMGCLENRLRSLNDFSGNDAKDSSFRDRSGGDGAGGSGRSSSNREWYENGVRHRTVGY